jgi:cysteinyl-tRNA synthetase
VPGSNSRLNWYSCGPTVYSHSHLGHARCYITFDVMRNVLASQFNLDVNYVMNITDIDDKIINAANAQGIDSAVFARRWETDFFEVMQLLGVKFPDRVVRVSEYIPEILDYIKVIIENGFAYVANGSVYFDVQEFKNRGYKYCKLDPNAELSSEGASEDLEKKSSKDFALWKKRKAGEPAWHSPWGEGRPGWHIECCAMIDSVFGGFGGIDLHTGGADLKFPHHDNEIAQAESYYQTKSWVPYFMHVGSLTIKGLKMSKSLKNFVTIREVLETRSARVLRLMFLLHRYNSELRFDPGTSFEEPEAFDKYFAQFFHSVSAVLNSSYEKGVSFKYNEEERALTQLLLDERSKAVAALANDIDTPTVVKIISTVVKALNKYLSATADPKRSLVQLYFEFVCKYLSMMGLKYEASSRPAATEGSHTAETLATVLLDYRKEILKAAKAKDLAGVFQASDRLRDEVCPKLGYLIQDNPSDVVPALIQDRLFNPADRPIRVFQTDGVEGSQSRRKERTAYRPGLEADPSSVLHRQILQIPYRNFVLRRHSSA